MAALLRRLGWGRTATHSCPVNFSGARIWTLILQGVFRPSLVIDMALKEASFKHGNRLHSIA
jgi:hypothetical protein